jgi:uncharacterized protein (DUF4415 family)
VVRRKFEDGRGYTQIDWNEVADTPPLQRQDLDAARAFADVFPQLAGSMKRRGRQKAPTKELVSLRLSRGTLAAFRASGAGWQKRIDEALAKAASEL